MITFLIITLAVSVLTGLVLLQEPKSNSKLVTETIGVKTNLQKATWIAGAAVMVIALIA